MHGGSTADAVFVLRRGTVDAVDLFWGDLKEKFRSKNKKLFFIFVDLKKVFDLVAR